MQHAAVRIGVWLALAMCVGACQLAAGAQPGPTLTASISSSLTATPGATATLAPTPLPTSTAEPSPSPTATPTVTPTRTPTRTPSPFPPTATHTPAPPTARPRPTAAPQATAAQPAASATPRPAPTGVAGPSDRVVSAFLSDARATQTDLFGVKVWFDRLAGGETIPCSTVFGHSIHQPISAAPGQVAELAPAWAEYQSALSAGQACLQWLLDFCSAGGGEIDETTFWDRRELSSSALSQCEHVVQALEQ
jgi:hypothetical protein